MLTDTIVSLIRTFVPVVVGAVIAYLAERGFSFTVDPMAVTGVVIGLYYGLARFLEKKWPFFGYLLGVPKEPAYKGTPGTPTVTG